MLRGVNILLESILFNTTMHSLNISTFKIRVSFNFRCVNIKNVYIIFQKGVNSLFFHSNVHVFLVFVCICIDISLLIKYLNTYQVSLSIHV